MRKTLTLALYLGCVELLSYLLVVVPAYSFQVSSSTTGYVRVASQAAMASMVAAQRAATLASVAPLLSGASAGSIAVRLVAGSVGWPALGIVAGMTLAMLYYNSTQVAALKAAAAPPGAVSVSGVGVSGTLKACSSNPACNQSYYDQYIVKGYMPSPPAPNESTCDYASFGNGGWGGPYSMAGETGCVWVHYTFSGADKAVQAAGSPATPQQLQDYIGNLPAGNPNSVESNTVPVGSQVSPTTADATASNPVPSTGLATSVVPATNVQPTDTVVNPNATPPEGTETTKTTSQPTTGTSTTTTTTTTNPDGSVTKTDTKTGEDTASVSCAAGNHEQRTFGSILQEHMNVWQGSGLLSALNLLKTLTWPSTPPTYTLTSSMFGSYTIDFSTWAGMLTAIRSLMIALAGFVAYRIVFVGSK
jgi:hypothetical protein